MRAPGLGAMDGSRASGVRVLAAVAALVLMTAAVVGALLAWAHALADVPLGEGEPLSVPLEKARLVRLVPSSEFDERVAFDVVGAPEEVAGTSLLLLRADDAHVYENGMLVQEFGSSYNAVRVADLSRASAAVGAGGSAHAAMPEVNGRDAAVRLEVEANGLFLSYSVYAGSSGSIWLAESVYYALHSISLAVLAVMFLYAVSLWAFKRDEHYLLVFAAYLAVVFSTFALRLVFQPEEASVSYSMMTSSLSAVKYCAIAYTIYLLVCRELPGWRTHVAVVAAIAVVALVRGVCSAASLSVVFAESTRIALLALAAAVVVFACARRADGAAILLVGFSPVLACEVVKATGAADFCLQLSLWWYTAAFDLPFALACMVFINRRFAGRHRAAQRLSDELALLNGRLDELARQRAREADEQATRRRALMLNVYHDLRSPLFVLGGCLDMLQGARGDEKDEIVGIMRERLGLATGLAEDLFTLAKFEDGDVTLSMGPVALDGVVRSTASALAVAAEGKGVHLASSIEGPCVVWGDAARLGQALQNLVCNAVEYTPAGGLVAVCLKRTEGDGGAAAGEGRCEVSVSDTGPGIDPQEVDLVFERYYRAKDAAVGHGSTGLGLSIAKSIVERHKGSIRVESAKGRGTTFTVSLPLLGEGAAGEGGPVDG